MEEVVNLFMNNDDLSALKLLYSKTNDELVKTLIDYKEQSGYEKDTNDLSNANLDLLYEGTMSYIWQKYNLNEVGGIN